MAYATDIQNYADLDELNTEDDEISEHFVKAADHLNGLVSKLDDNTLLNLYAYYKQGTEGSCNIPKPSWYNAKGKAKWEAWDNLKNMPQNEAKHLYIKMIESIDPKFGTFNNKDGWVRISTLQLNEPLLSVSEKSLVDYVKDGNYAEAANILASYDSTTAIDLLNKLDEDGLGLIHWAADRGFSEILKIIISCGANVNLVDSDMQTALHYAASCGHIDCIMVLLKNKADVNLKDADGLDPKAVASDENIKELLSSVL